MWVWNHLSTTKCPSCPNNFDMAWFLETSLGSPNQVLSFFTENVIKFWCWKKIEKIPYFHGFYPYINKFEEFWRYVAYHPVKFFDVTSPTTQRSWKESSNFFNFCFLVETLYSPDLFKSFRTIIRIATMLLGLRAMLTEICFSGETRVVNNK